MNANFSQTLKKGSALFAGLVLAMQLALPTVVFAQTTDIVEGTIELEVTAEQLLKEKGTEEEKLTVPDVICEDTPETYEEKVFLDGLLGKENEVSAICETTEENEEIPVAEEVEAQAKDEPQEENLDATMFEDEPKTEDLPQLLSYNTAINEEDDCPVYESVPLRSFNQYNCEEPVACTTYNEVSRLSNSFLRVAIAVPEVDYCSGTIEGIKFNDVNGNAVHDIVTEEKLSGWTISICEIYNSEEDYFSLSDCDGEIFSTNTDSNGNYTFNDVLLGEYLVCETQQPGWTRTYPATNDCQKVFIESDGQVCLAVFGNKANTPGQVLGTSTPPVVVPKVLANTGTPLTQGLLVGMSILGAASGVTYLNRRKQYLA